MNGTVESDHYSATPILGVHTVHVLPQDVVPRDSLSINAAINTTHTGGIIFDVHSEDDFKFAVLSVANDEVWVGHYSVHQGWRVGASAPFDGDIDRFYELSVKTENETLPFKTENQTVRVFVDGQELVSYTFSGQVIDGDFGLISRQGTSVFEHLTFLSDARDQIRIVTSATMEDKVLPGETVHVDGVFLVDGLVGGFIDWGDGVIEELLISGTTFHAEHAYSHGAVFDVQATLINVDGETINGRVRSLW